jgi:hypothetical protein
MDGDEIVSCAEPILDLTAHVSRHSERMDTAAASRESANDASCDGSAERGDKRACCQECSDSRKSDYRDSRQPSQNSSNKAAGLCPADRIFLN